MPLPLQVTFRGLDPSEAIARLVRSKARRLERFNERVASCHVTVEAPPQHRRKGGTYRVSVKLLVPGGEIVASRESAKNHAHEDVYVALRDAFAAVVRQLEDHAQLQRGAVKTHAPPERPSAIRSGRSQEQ